MCVCDLAASSKDTYRLLWHGSAQIQGRLGEVNYNGLTTWFCSSAVRTLSG